MFRMPSHSGARQSSSLRGSIFSGARRASLTRRGLRCILREFVIAALVPMGANLRRIISLSVVIVRACGRSSKHGTSHFARLYPHAAEHVFLDAPLEEGHDEGEICGEA